jgi:hypothetical protein
MHQHQCGYTLEDGRINNQWFADNPCSANVKKKAPIIIGAFSN